MHVLTSPHLWRRTSLSSMRRPDDPVRKKLTKRPASPLVGGRLFWPAGCHEVPDCASLIGLNADRNCKNRAVFLVALECSVVILQHLNRFGSLGGLVLFTLDEIDTADSGMSCVGIPFPSAVIPPPMSFNVCICTSPLQQGFMQMLQMSLSWRSLSGSALCHFPRNILVPTDLCFTQFSLPLRVIL